MSLARHRALTHVDAELSWYADDTVEMRLARHRALTLLYNSVFCICINHVEMRLARHRALTQYIVFIVDYVVIS